MTPNEYRLATRMPEMDDIIIRQSQTIGEWRVFYRQYELAPDGQWHPFGHDQTGWPSADDAAEFAQNQGHHELVSIHMLSEMAPAFVGVDRAVRVPDEIAELIAINCDGHYLDGFSRIDDFEAWQSLVTTIINNGMQYMGITRNDPEPVAS